MKIPVIKKLTSIKAKWASAGAAKSLHEAASEITSVEEQERKQRQRFEIIASFN